MSTVIVYAPVDARDPLGDVLDLHLDRAAAESELCGIIGDEPAWAPFIGLVEIERAFPSRAVGVYEHRIVAGVRGPSRVQPDLDRR